MCLKWRQRQTNFILLWVIEFDIQKPQQKWRWYCKIWFWFLRKWDLETIPTGTGIGRKKFKVIFNEKFTAENSKNSGSSVIYELDVWNPCWVNCCDFLSVSQLLITISKFNWLSVNSLRCRGVNIKKT